MTTRESETDGIGPDRNGESQWKEEEEDDVDDMDECAPKTCVDLSL